MYSTLPAALLSFPKALEKDVSEANAEAAEEAGAPNRLPPPKTF
jgi:hypothetical protein